MYKKKPYNEKNILELPDDTPYPSELLDYRDAIASLELPHDD